MTIASKTMALGRKIGRNVVGAASDALSFPSVARAGKQIIQANRDTAVLKGARQFKGVPAAPGSQAFMFRTMADEVRSRRSNSK